MLLAVIYPTKPKIIMKKRRKKGIKAETRIFPKEKEYVGGNV
jgi:hypothetical protein